MIKNRLLKKISNTGCNFVLITFSVLCIIPLILVLSISLSDNAQIISDGYSFIPRGFNVEAYKYIMKDSWSIVNAYKTTIIVTVSGTIVGLLSTVMIAYPISRRDYALRGVVSFAVFFTMLFNGGLVPTYILMTRYLNLSDNLLALILPGLVVPWNVILFKSFLMDIPTEITEAATIDGANEFSILFKIIMPLSKPALATVGLFIILQYFNDWQGSMLYMTDSSKISLQYFLYKTLNNIEEARKNRMFFEADMVFPQEPVRMAMAVLAIFPIIVVFPFLQKYFVKGITLGSVKG